MHRLQQHILQQLIRHPGRRYSELKPADVEGNIFMYHLRQLIKQGHVEKNEAGNYCLTASGQGYADRYSLKLSAQRTQPRIVTMVASHKEAGEWLWYRRHRQPLIGQVGFIYGNLHLGESIEAAAARELAEKAGFAADLSHRGDGYLYIYDGEDVVSAFLFHLFVGDNLRPTEGRLSDAGGTFWAKFADVEANELIPGTAELVKLVETGEKPRFWTELRS